MTRAQKQALACVLFVPAIIGALTPSYLHLAAWYRAWMPAGWEDLAYVAALVTEAPVFACTVSLTLLPSALLSRWPVYALLGYSVLVSIYVNARWAWGHTATPLDRAEWWAKAMDVTLGSAVLPLFALAGGLVLDFVLRTVVASPVKVKAERKATQAATTGPIQPAASGGLAEKWRALVAEHGTDKTQAQLAALAGVSRQAVSNWKRAAEGGT